MSVIIDHCLTIMTTLNLGSELRVWGIWRRCSPEDNILLKIWGEVSVYWLHLENGVSVESINIKATFLSVLLSGDTGKEWSFRLLKVLDSKLNIFLTFYKDVPSHCINSDQSKPNPIVTEKRKPRLSFIFSFFTWFL